MKDNDINISDYRYERKFFIKELSRYEVESIVNLHPAIFSGIYRQRYVNNIYFDSFSLNSYHENIEGLRDRIKIRIRWYGELFGYVEKPVLEFKIKRGLLGKKISYPLKSFNLNRDTKITDILKSIVKLKEISFIKFEDLIPSLLNRYSRKYYQSSNKKYRITVDTDQSFYNINKENNTFLNSYFDNTSVILELKYLQEHDIDATHIVSNFPFRITKSSKYVSGIEKFNHMSNG